MTGEVVSFPSSRLDGHARRVAERLAGARSHREADLFLNWALRARLGQLVKAGLSPRDVLDQRDDFKRLIHRQCIQIRSEWMPVFAKLTPVRRLCLRKQVDQS